MLLANWQMRNSCRDTKIVRILYFLVSILSFMSFNGTIHCAFFFRFALVFVADQPVPTPDTAGAHLSCHVSVLFDKIDRKSEVA